MNGFVNVILKDNITGEEQVLLDGFNTFFDGGKIDVINYVLSNGGNAGTEYMSTSCYFADSTTGTAMDYFQSASNNMCLSYTHSALNLMDSTCCERYASTTMPQGATTYDDMGCWKSMVLGGSVYPADFPSSMNRVMAYKVFDNRMVGRVWGHAAMSPTTRTPVFFYDNGYTETGDTSATPIITGAFSDTTNSYAYVIHITTDGTCGYGAAGGDYQIVRYGWDYNNSSASAKQAKSILGGPFEYSSFHQNINFGTDPYIYAKIKDDFIWFGAGGTTAVSGTKIPIINITYPGSGLFRSMLTTQLYDGATTESNLVDLVISPTDKYTAWFTTGSTTFNASTNSLIVKIVYNPVTKDFTTTK